jgi:DNA-directed RNA polymerase subunit F
MIQESGRLATMNEEWVTIQEASEYLKVRRNKISRLVSRGIIQTRDNPLDARVRLVDLSELRILFEKYGKRIGEEHNNEDM